MFHFPFHLDPPQNATGFAVTNGSSPVMIKNSIKENKFIGLVLDSAGEKGVYAQNKIRNNPQRMQSNVGVPEGLDE